MTDGPIRRRALLRLSALAAAWTGGCATFRSDGATSTEPAGMASTPAAGTGAEGPTATPDSAVAPTASGSPAPSTTGAGAVTPALDLREANVTAVDVEPADDGVYRFSVTLYHDDDGEDGYANWWQVETRDGERLGRRELLHPHSTAPFTRSEAVEIPNGTACVVVRGHDRTHGYGGRAMLVAVDSGATRPVDQGTERRSLADRECPGGTVSGSTPSRTP